jgi:hypothetical protein
MAGKVGCWMYNFQMRIIYKRTDLARSCRSRRKRHSITKKRALNLKNRYGSPFVEKITHKRRR